MTFSELNSNRIQEAAFGLFGRMPHQEYPDRDNFNIHFVMHNMTAKVIYQWDIPPRYYNGPFDELVSWMESNVNVINVH